MSQTREVEVVTSVQQKQLVAVTFPVYRESSDSSEGGEWTTLTRINSDLTSVSITRRRSWHSTRVQWEIETDVRVLLSSDDAGLTSNYTTPATREEFEAMLAELTETVAALLPPREAP